jgi:hypothetical protein
MSSMWQRMTIRCGVQGSIVRHWRLFAARRCLRIAEKDTPVAGADGDLPQPRNWQMQRQL